MGPCGWTAKRKRKGILRPKCIYFCRVLLKLAIAQRRSFAIRATVISATCNRFTSCAVTISAPRAWGPSLQSRVESYSGIPDSSLQKVASSRKEPGHANRSTMEVCLQRYELLATQEERGWSRDYRNRIKQVSAQDAFSISTQKQGSLFRLCLHDPGNIFVEVFEIQF